MIGAVRPGCWRVDGDVDVDGECWAMVSSCRSDWSFPERIIRESGPLPRRRWCSTEQPAAPEWDDGLGKWEGSWRRRGSERQEASHLRVALRQADPGEDRQRGGKEKPGILQPHLRRDRAAEVAGQQDGADERGARQGVEDRADQQRDADRDNGALRVAEVDA